MKISNENLKKSACFAMMEGNRWRTVALKIGNEKGLIREKIVILSYVTELYLKSLLMYNNINITIIPKDEMKNRHNLYSLYKLLPYNIKEKIVKEMKFEPIKVLDFYTGETKKIYNSFEEILELISNDFQDLRYNYERYDNRKANFSDR